jgi:hypothetical protein
MGEEAFRHIRRERVMPKVKSKHKDNELMLQFGPFNKGLNEEAPARFLSPKELSKCVNFKYINRKVEDTTYSGGYRIETTLRLRQGVEKISNSALPLSVSIRNATYYINQDQYIIATDTKVYYLDASFDPVEIGTVAAIPTFTEFKSKLYIHDGGVLKSWDGTTYETVADRYDDELIGTGDGTTVTFTGTLAHPVVLESSITITYYDVDGTEYTITDDGVSGWAGDVSAGSITYASGAFSITCDHTPADDSTITISYKKASGAPKCYGGIVRQSRLYLFYDPDNTSRLWYSGVNDGYAWNSTSDGGYVDADPDDGQILYGAINFFSTMLLLKSRSIKRLNGFPGDAEFGVEPLSGSIGTTCYRSVIEGMGIVSFLNTNGWRGMDASDRYGDIQESMTLSKNFQTTVLKYINANSIAEFFPTDNQFWLGLYDTSASDQLSYIYVISVPDAQVSKYRFNFNWSCFKYVNGEMLIGSDDGLLYRMTEALEDHQDDGESYAGYSTVATADTNWGLPYNKKHCEYTRIDINGSTGYTGSVKLYKNHELSPFSTLTISSAASIALYSIFGYGSSYEIFDMDAAGFEIAPPQAYEYSARTRFNYNTLMAEFTGVYGIGGVDILGITMKSDRLGK